MRSLPLWHLYWNQDSGSQLIFKDKTIEMKPDFLVLIPPHTFFATRNMRPFKHFFIDFSLDEAPFSRLKKQEYLFPSEKFRHLLDRHFSESTLEHFRLYAIVFEVLLNLPQDAYLEVGKTPLDPRILQALEFIDSKQFRGLSNSIICRNAGMSVEHFQHLFKQVTGLSPKQYIINVRLTQARNLLINSNLTIDEVAVETGFSNRYHFSKSFSAMFNVPPARFRKQNKG